MIELDRRTRRMVDEVRELGRTYMRPMGLESDRSGDPPPAEHPFYLICSRQGGLVSREIGEGERENEGHPNEASLAWRPLRSLLTNEEAAYWDRGVALSLPGPGLGGAALRSMATAEQSERFLSVFTDHSRAHWGGCGAGSRRCRSCRSSSC